MASAKTSIFARPRRACRAYVRGKALMKPTAFVTKIVDVRA